ncbi:LysR family transcriptional regulator [Vibrio mytili]|uniref:LysR family transcriptional regulator n=1 Tax=Vibrio mytili TaxID=50718 RepID=UPI003C6F4CCE
MFETAARLGSFAKASEELCVTTAAISKQIKTIEEAINIQLFNRSKSGVTLTSQGERYLESASKALQILENEANHYVDVDEATSVLNVEVGLCFLHFWLLPKLDSFRQHYPNIQINLIVNNERTEANTDDAYDVAFFYSKVDTSNRDNYLLFHDRGLLAASPNFVNSRLTNSDLSYILKQPKIMLKEELPIWEGWESLCKKLGVEYNISDDVLFVEDQVAVMQAAINDGGIALVTEWHAQDLLESGQLVALTPTVEYEDKAYFLAESSTGNHEAAKLLIDWVTAQV